MLYAELTVQETILFAAQMKLEAKDDAERLAAVNRLTDRFGLAEVRNSRIGDIEQRGISGGERKRVSIAEQLVSNPRLVFLDEPTTGLDAFTAMSLCERIKNYARQDRKTVLMTIHQPRLEIIKKFDRIALLAEGRVVFFGTVEEAIEHFARLGFACPPFENPADFFLDLLTVQSNSEENVRDPEIEAASRARIQYLIAACPAINISSQNTPPPLIDQSQIDREEGRGRERKKYVRPASTQFWLLLKRNFRIIARQWQQQCLDIAAILVVGLLISFVFFQLPLTFVGARSRLGLLFLIIVHVIFFVVAGLRAVFAMDRQVILKERYASMYHLSMAYFARFVSFLPVKLITFTVYAFLIYYIAGLSRGHSFANFIVFWATLMAIVFTSLCLGICIASFSTKVQQAQILSTVIVVIFVLFGGNLAVAGGVTWILRWIQYVSFIFYGYQALSQNSLKGLEFATNVGGKTGFVSGDAYLKTVSLDTLPVVAGALGVLGFGMLFLVLGYFILYWRTKPRMVISTRPSTLLTLPTLQKPENNNHLSNTEAAMAEREAENSE